MKFGRKFTFDKLIFYSISAICITLGGLACLIPFILILSGSFTAESAIMVKGYNLWPPEFSTEAYELLFKAPKTILTSYVVTICVTAVGTFLGLMFTSMCSFVLYRKDFKWRNGFAFFFFFTTLFGGGLVPWYILIVRYLGWKDTYMVLVVTGLFNVFYIILMRSFMTSSIPISLVESARIDGAGDFRIFIRIMLPLLKPALATIGLFIALAYWNQWYITMLFINKESMYTLQFFLYKLLNSIRFAQLAAAESGIPMPQMPSESFKLAMTVVATGPIIFLYPFVQKYFVSGITIGAVKG